VFDNNENWQVRPHDVLLVGCQACTSHAMHPVQRLLDEGHFTADVLTGGLFCRWLAAPLCYSQATPRRLASPSSRQQQRSTQLQCRCE
jgi:hypothetical protein